MAASLASHIALVTGSTSGVGFGIARALASRGAAIVLTGLGDDKLIQECQQSIKDDFDVPVSFVPANLSDQLQVHKLAQTVIKDHPPGPDILVNNAGFVHVSHVESHPIEVWDQLLAVMLTTPFLLTKYLLPGMRRKEWGRIININSCHGLVGTAGKCGYSAAKHGLMGLTKTVAMDIADTGVTCNSINPGVVDTQIFRSSVDKLVTEKGITKEAAEMEVLAKQPIKKCTTVDQIGEAALFLCSSAADTMTGATITMDGGWTAT
ncbi:D-beta-hydroxybutyrate dehydrogenase-like [Amphiura filiformis]|uniref:D-beta-hydroxybutyrate dehydrogenase-like n=1 Tax=Amphiura filiformis TaxID=82378 RepID=UPI003B210FE6